MRAICLQTNCPRWKSIKPLTTHTPQLWAAVYVFYIRLKLFICVTFMASPPLTAICLPRHSEVQDQKQKQLLPFVSFEWIVWDEWLSESLAVDKHLAVSEIRPVTGTRHSECSKQGGAGFEVVLKDSSIL